MLHFVVLLIKRTGLKIHRVLKFTISTLICRLSWLASVLNADLQIVKVLSSPTGTLIGLFS